MRTIKVEFTLKLPVDATNEEIQRWLNFALGATGSIERDNPLADHDLEANRDVGFR